MMCLSYIMQNEPCKHDGNDADADTSRMWSYMNIEDEEEGARTHTPTQNQHL